MARFIVSCAILSVAVVAQSSRPAEQPATSAVARGEYIVHSVAMCVQCHSPRDEAGNLLVDELLQGARMPVRSPFPAKQFAFETPKLAGLPAGFSEETLAHFLETGDPGYGRARPKPPMPPFRMNETDAKAVAAYLKSLK